MMERRESSDMTATWRSSASDGEREETYERSRRRKLKRVEGVRVCVTVRETV